MRSPTIYISTCLDTWILVSIMWFFVCSLLIIAFPSTAPGISGMVAGALVIFALLVLHSNERI